VPTTELAGVTVNDDTSDRSRRDSSDQMDSQRDSLRDSPTMERAFTAPEMPPPLQMPLPGGPPKAPSQSLPAEQAAAEEWVMEDGKPKMGFTTRDAASLSMRDGAGTGFELRIGPDYKRNGKKAPSVMHVYQPVSIDVFKTKPSAVYHISQRLTLPLPPGGKRTPNQSGLPRRFIVNAIIPSEAPSLLGGPPDGPCYQVVIAFTASAAALQEWVDAGSSAARLFARFVKDAPEGIVPSSGDIDIKERVKLVPRVENMKQMGLGWIERYNGKPALITKSGSVYRGDDYIEVCMNTFRFAYMTKKGVNSLINRIPEFDLHTAITLEGREDRELPEQTLLAVRLKGLDLVKMAFDIDEHLPVTQ